MDALENVLRVFRVHSKKIRLGPHADGGYVVTETLLDNSDRLISIGVGQQFQFEDEWYYYTGKPIEMYDGYSLPTIDGTSLPKFDSLSVQQVRNILYVKRNIGNGPDEIPLAVVLSGKKNALLKMDIEGGEYSAFNGVTDVSHLAGILLEVHDLADSNVSKLFAELYMEKFEPHFYLFHIHANNCEAGTLELSLISERLVFNVAPETEKFPISGLDFPNDPNKPDIILDWINK